MKRLIMLVHIFSMIFVLSVFAQEDTPPSHDMTPPPPLDNAFMNWMVGEWQGTSTSPMGNSTEYMKIEMGLNGQFMIMTYKGKREDGHEMSGMGAITMDKEGKLVGYWIDSWRTMSEGHGMQEGATSKMEWATAMGPYLRTTEKVDENAMKINGVMKGSDSKEMKSVSELKRIISKR